MIAVAPPTFSSAPSRTAATGANANRRQRPSDAEAENFSSKRQKVSGTADANSSDVPSHGSPDNIPKLVGAMEDGALDAGFTYDTVGSVCIDAAGVKSAWHVAAGFES